MIVGGLLKVIRGVGVIAGNSLENRLHRGADRFACPRVETFGCRKHGEPFEARNEFAEIGRFAHAADNRSKGRLVAPPRRQQKRDPRRLVGTPCVWPPVWTQGLRSNNVIAGEAEVGAPDAARGESECDSEAAVVLRKLLALDLPAQPLSAFRRDDPRQPLL